MDYRTDLAVESEEYLKSEDMTGIDKREKRTEKTRVTEIKISTDAAANATSTFGNIAVRNTTPSHSINIESSLNAPLELHISDKSKPTVLIYHTHTTEAYEMLDEGWFTNSYSTRSRDPSVNMVRVGDAICEELEKQGIGVIHDTEIHDLKYTGAYDH